MVMVMLRFGKFVNNIRSIKVIQKFTQTQLLVIIFAKKKDFVFCFMQVKQSKKKNLHHHLYIMVYLLEKEKFLISFFKS